MPWRIEARADAAQRWPWTPGLQGSRGLPRRAFDRVLWISARPTDHDGSIRSGALGRSRMPREISVPPAHLASLSPYPVPEGAKLLFRVTRFTTDGFLMGDVCVL